MPSQSERNALDPFPMLDGPPIPWFLAGIIHEHLYRCDQSLERVAERGGFAWGEVRVFWRDPKWRTTPEQRALASRVARESLERLRDGR